MNKSVAFKVLCEVPREFKKGQIIRMDGEDFKVTSINEIKWATSHIVEIIGWCKKVTG